MKIGELARATHTLPETVRFYERLGLLPPPPRTRANYRDYSREDVQRLSFIRHCRSLDMTLEEIRRLLELRDEPGRSCGDADDLVAAHVQKVVARIRELEALEAELRSLRKDCSTGRTAAECGILGGLNRAAESAIA